MTIHVYITEQCRRDIDTQKYMPFIDAFKNKIEVAQHTDVFDRFPPPFLKKRFERQVRLVAKECLLDGHTVVAFLRLLVRGGGEYGAFGDSGYRILPGFDKMASELSDAALMKFIESRKEPPAPPPAAPSNEESGYLHSVLSATQNIYHDSHCCETKLWVDTIETEEFANRLNLFVEPIFDTISSTKTGLAEARCKGKDNHYGFLYRRVPEQNTLILFTPFKDHPPREKVMAMYPDLLADGALNKEAALKRSKRAYPHELLLSEDAWFRVQKDKEGNMALSLEEIEVLESARASGGGYPLFINGRAGSGKSTILQYLFSEYLCHHFESGKATAGPVLFACNDELLARSGSSVRAILRARHGRSAAKSQQFSEWVQPFESDFREAFRNFHSWLHQLANSETFSAEKLIDYGRFKQWWESRFGKEPSARKLFDADISWHVIRTYIKGINPEGYLEPDDYLEVPAKQKSVTPETFELVFEKVWRRYREDQKEKGFWDHQDLVRYVLEKDLVKPLHPAVFCDEAQDFTRIELETLHRHCLFNARTLNVMDLGHVPLAFAGDPFQTLNPTGFRWEATKAFFTEKFIRSFPGVSRELNYCELTYNYRSSQHIVRFCNSLQLVRSVAFDFPEIKPQHPWEYEEDTPSVVYYERGDLEVLKTLKSQSEIRIIVPCEEGGEAAWARAHGLADFVEFDEADVPKNVVSPTRVKGLEFTRVVLFGFAGACPAALRKAIAASSITLEGDQAIEPQYFLNRLYVAASRPRKRLFIVDTATDIESFWNPIFANQETFILRTQHSEQWEGMCGGLRKGSLETWESDKEDPLDTAEKLSKEGRLRKDRVLLRQAAQSYETAKKPKFAKQCRSEALELEGHFIEAARNWQEIEEFDKSLAAAWNHGSGGYDFIIELAQSRPDLRNRIHYKVADFIKKERGMTEGVAVLKDLVEALEDDSLRSEVLFNANWLSGIEIYLRRMLEVGAEETGLWKVVYSSVKSLLEAGVRISREMAGEIAFRGDLLKDAYKQWEEIPADKRSKFERSFLRAKAAASSFPQNLDVFAELLSTHQNRKDADDFLDLVQREGVENLKAPHREMVVVACLIIGEHDRVFSSISDVTSVSVLVDVLEVAAQGGTLNPIQFTLGRLVTVLAGLERWTDLLTLFRDGTMRGFRLEATKRWAASHSCQFAKPFIEFIGGSSQIESVRRELKTPLANHILEQIGRSLEWRSEIHPLVVGRALERIGLFKETLPFYEMLTASNLLSEETKRLAWQRWARTKWLQALREREQGSTSRFDKAFKEAMEKAESCGFRTPEAIPEYLPSPLPDVDAPTVVPAVETTAATAEPIPVSPPAKKPVKKTMEEPAAPDRDFSRKLQIGVLEIRVTQDGTRMNVTHSETLEQASVNIPRGTISFESENIEVDDEQQAVISKWDLALDLSALASSGELLMRTSDGLGLIVPVVGYTSK